jgi:hypothetical protein
MAAALENVGYGALDRSGGIHDGDAIPEWPVAPRETSSRFGPLGMGPERRIKCPWIGKRYISRDISWASGNFAGWRHNVHLRLSNGNKFPIQDSQYTGNRLISLDFWMAPRLPNRRRRGLHENCLYLVVRCRSDDRAE